MVLCVHDERMEATGRWTAQVVPLCCRRMLSTQRRPPSTQRRSLLNARRWVLDGGRRKVDTSERGHTYTHTVLKLLKKLETRKAIRLDGVSGHVLKECRHQLSGPITDIIKCSLSTGRVPKEWKRADIIPLYKSGNREEPLNYN